MNQVFETMNERGSKLTPSDLIKNHLFNYTKNPDKLDADWKNLFCTITKYVEPTVFLFDSYRSRHFEKEDKNATSNNIHDFVMKKIDDDKSAKDYIDQLNDDKEFLVKLYDTKSQVFSHVPRSVQLLRAIHIRAPLLAAHRECNSDDYSRLAYLLVKFFFKQKIIFNEHASVIADVTFKTVEKN